MKRTPFAHIFILIAFLANTFGAVPTAKAQEFKLPAPGIMVHLSPEFTPAHLQGMTIHPDNALQFDFLINRGDEPLTEAQKKEEYAKLVKYFLASLTVPDQDQWVNLSPYEKNRIIEDNFGKTEMGRDLLAQDYILKQITSSLIYPEENLGKKFWDKIYERAWKEYGSTNVPVNTFNKVWIIPDEAVVYESGNTAYVLRNHLKVMLEEDYEALNKNNQKAESPKGISIEKDAHTLGSQIVREVILPELEREVNEGKNFANLRQIYSGMILATWYKKALKESLLGKVYANRAKVKGVNQPACRQAGMTCVDNEAIYQQYLKAFKKGVFNYIKEDVDKYSQQAIPRKYFSGGTRAFTRAEYGTEPKQGEVAIVTSETVRDLPSGTFDLAALAENAQNVDRATIALNTAEEKDAAMTTLEKIDNLVRLIGDAHQAEKVITEPFTTLAVRDNFQNLHVSVKGFTTKHIQHKVIVALGAVQILRQLAVVTDWKGEERGGIDLFIDDSLASLGLAGIRNGEEPNNIYILVNQMMLRKKEDVEESSEAERRRRDIDIYEGKYDADLDEEVTIHILAHEMAHAYLGHLKLAGQALYKEGLGAFEREHAADLLAAQWLWQMGYTDILRIMRKGLTTMNFAFINESKTHPDLEKRIKYVKSQLSLIQSRQQIYKPVSFLDRVLGEIQTDNAKVFAEEKDSAMIGVMRDLFTLPKTEPDLFKQYREYLDALIALVNDEFSKQYPSGLPLHYQKEVFTIAITADEIKKAGIEIPYKELLIILRNLDPLVFADTRLEVFEALKTSEDDWAINLTLKAKDAVGVTGFPEEVLENLREGDFISDKFLAPGSRVIIFNNGAIISVQFNPQRNITEITFIAFPKAERIFTELRGDQTGLGLGMYIMILDAVSDEAENRAPPDDGDDLNEYGGRGDDEDMAMSSLKNQKSDGAMLTTIRQLLVGKVSGKDVTDLVLQHFGKSRNVGVVTLKAMKKLSGTGSIVTTTDGRQIDLNLVNAVSYRMPWGAYYWERKEFDKKDTPHDFLRILKRDTGRYDGGYYVVGYDDKAFVKAIEDQIVTRPLISQGAGESGAIVPQSSALDTISSQRISADGGVSLGQGFFILNDIPPEAILDLHISPEQKMRDPNYFKAGSRVIFKANDSNTWMRGTIREHAASLLELIGDDGIVRVAGEGTVSIGRIFLVSDVLDRESSKELKDAAMTDVKGASTLVQVSKPANILIARARYASRAILEGIKDGEGRSFIALVYNNDPQRDALLNLLRNIVQRSKLILVSSPDGKVYGIRYDQEVEISEILRQLDIERRALDLSFQRGTFTLMIGERKVAISMSKAGGEYKILIEGTEELQMNVPSSIFIHMDGSASTATRNYQANSDVQLEFNVRDARLFISVKNLTERPLIVNGFDVKASARTIQPSLKEIHNFEKRGGMADWLITNHATAFEGYDIVKVRTEIMHILNLFKNQPANFLLSTRPDVSKGAFLAKGEQEIDPRQMNGMQLAQFIEVVRLRLYLSSVSERMAEGANLAMISADPAMNTKGGIDLNSANLNLQIKRDGKGVPLPLVQQDLNQLMQIQGFVPVIIEIKPAVNLSILSELQQKLQTAPALASAT